jgi:hypothetical protein
LLQCNKYFMKNPWLYLSSSPSFILKNDLEIIAKFNESPQTRTEYKIQTQLYPEPFLGDIFNAKVLLLNLNPGFHEDDTDHHKNNTNLKKLSKDNLSHDFDNEYPFYFLNPLLKDTPGGKWWNSRLKYLIQETSVKKIAQTVACIEYFPYHSEKFGFKLAIPSQDYSFHLVQQAIKKGTLIVVMRSIGKWWPKIREVDCNKLIRLNSDQSTVVSPGNCVQIEKITTLLNN